MSTREQLNRERTAKDLEMMKHPGEWPAWPALPVKHKRDRDGVFPRCGVVFATGKSIVYETNLYNLGPDIEVDKLNRTEYPSFEALAEDWWVD